MKRYIGYSLLVATIVFATSPIHDSMDNRIKGKSYTGSLDDNIAAQDGLGLLPLQHHTGTTEVNNELLVQKVLNRIVKTETDKTKTLNTKNSLTTGLVGTVSDLNILTQTGVSLSYVPGSLKTCKEILSNYPTSSSGVYKVSPDGNSYDVQCDMTTDGGGWTLVSYAGTIAGNKTSTTGNSSKTWLPLIFKWGSVQSNSTSTKVSFSRFDIVKSFADSNDQIMAKRTSNLNNILIFPITNVSWFGRNSSEGHFSITSTNRNLAYLKMTNSGPSSFKTVTNGTKWSYVNSSSNSYPGIDWNVGEGDNCDNCGRSYTSGLNHRSMLYWETYDIDVGTGYYLDQWFHASPMTMKDSVSYDNNVQDMEFWFREQ